MSDPTKFSELHKEQQQTAERARKELIANLFGNNNNDFSKMLIVAHIQSGKFGTKSGTIDKLFVSLCEIHMQSREIMKSNANTDLYIWLPADKALENQTRTRLSVYNSIFNRSENPIEKLLGENSILHYGSSKKIKQAKKQLQKSADLGRNIIVIEDESHIGKAVDGKSGDFLTFFEQLKMKDNAKKIYVSVTATPTHLSGHTFQEFLNLGWSVEFLDYNENYYGLKDLVNSNRFHEMTWDLKQQEDIVDFLHAEFFKTWDNTDKGFAVFRLPQATFELFERTVKDEFSNMGMDTPEIILFDSKSKNIDKFVKYFSGIEKTKSGKAIFCIVESIKQGITLDQSKIMTWVDRLNSSTDKLLYDNIAMHAQSLGRNVGYFTGKYDYPVYGNYDAIMHHVNDVEIFREAVLFNKKTNHVFCHTGSNAKPMKNKRKPLVPLAHKDIKIKDIIVCSNLEDMNNVVYNLQHKTRNVNTCSSNIKDFSKSIIWGNLNQHGTAVRDQTCHDDPTTLVTPVYLDSPSPSDDKGYYNMLADTQWGDLRGKYVIILSEEEYSTDNVTDKPHIKNTLVLCS